MAAFALMLVLALAPVKITVHGPTATPKINTRWNYSVSITENGKPVAGKLTEQIIDPIGGHHAVQFGANTKPITNIPVKGVFRDYIIWPRISRGLTLKLHVIVKVAGKTYTKNYIVTPR